MATISLANPTTKGDTLTRRLPDGTILALASDGISSYRIDLSAGTCECKSFAFRRGCRHLSAAQARYGEQCWHSPAAPARYGEQGCPVCNASPLGLCPSCANAPKPQPAPKPEPCVGDMYPCDCPRCRKGAA